jgi:hypothetical protein
MGATTEIGFEAKIKVAFGTERTLPAKPNRLDRSKLTISTVFCSFRRQLLLVEKLTELVCEGVLTLNAYGAHDRLIRRTAGVPIGDDAACQRSIRR